MGIAMPTGWSAQCDHCEHIQFASYDHNPEGETLECEKCGKEFTIDDVDVS